MQLRTGRWPAVLTTIVLAGQLATMLAPAIAFSADAAPMSAREAKTSVDNAVSDYSHARFDDAITRLRELVGGGQLSGDQLQRAREYLARSLAKRGFTQEADRVFQDMLAANPKWRPDLNDVPPDESAVFDLALKEFQAAGGAPVAPEATPAAPAPAESAPAPAESAPAPAAASPETKAAQLGNPAPSGEGHKSSKKMWYAIGGVAVVGTVAALAGGGGKSGSSKPLPGFPGTP